MQPVNHPADNMTMACPNCDVGGDVRERTTTNRPRTGDPDHKYLCGDCGATFDDPVPREKESYGGRAKYESLTLEDVGLDGDE